MRRNRSRSNKIFQSHPPFMYRGLPYGSPLYTLILYLFIFIQLIEHIPHAEHIHNTQCTVV